LLSARQLSNYNEFEEDKHAISDDNIKKLDSLEEVPGMDNSNGSEEDVFASAFASSDRDSELGKDNQPDAFGGGVNRRE